jgi:tRNA 2-thiouridine synthesizing protein A
MPDADHTLNALGMLCPLPILFAARDMGHLEPGQILEVVGDDPGLLEDVPAWCRKAGHRLVSMDEEEGVIVCRVEKGTGRAGSDEGEEEPAEAGETPGAA